ncbi:MAG TPA: dCTP deaminase [Methanolinea sp.]|nr:dCTP deaminase [Methanolinea sp.]HQK55755.1 dCTP deaminase [Methanolinea sp.]
MILSSSEIARRLRGCESGGELVIEPYSEECQQPASYDLRVGGDFVLPPGICTLVSTLERVELPSDLAATLRCRSSFGRRGIVLTAGFVDPGFRGQLTLCLVNMGAEHLTLRKNDRVVQIIFHQVTDGRSMYSGRYQDSTGVIQAR